MLRRTWLQPLRSLLGSSPRGRTLRRPRRATEPALVQLLEPRKLLSASPIGGEALVNQTTAGNQSAPAMASDADGDYVVAWTSVNSAGDANIFAQRYNAAGQKIATEFQVNQTAAGTQSNPSVAMDADGDFVITWDSAGQDGSGQGVYAQRYDAQGNRLGQEFRVNSFTSGDQMFSHVAMDAAGNFVVTWSSAQDGNLAGVYAQRYDAQGLAKGPEFRVNQFTTGNQWLSRVAMDNSGDFVIVWSSINQTGDTGSGIYGQRYDANGQAVGGEFHVNTLTAGNQQNVRVASDGDGDFVVAWDSNHVNSGDYDVWARRYDFAGTAQAAEFRVNSVTAGSQSLTSVDIDADGDFLVAWNSLNQVSASSGNDVYAKRYSSTGTVVNEAFRVNGTSTGNQSGGVIALDDDGDHVIAWTSNGQDGSGDGIYAQRYNETAERAGPLVTDLVVAGDVLYAGEQLVTPPNSLTVRFSENLSTAGGTTGAASVTNKANWQLTRNGVNLSSQIQTITFGLNPTSGKYEAVLTFSAPLTAGDYALTARQAITDVVGNRLDGNQNGVAGGDFVRNFRVATPQAGAEFLVNQTTAGQQTTIAGFSAKSVAMDAAGNSIVVWTGPWNGTTTTAIYGRRYGADGAPSSGEFIVSFSGSSSRTAPRVAMNSHGEYVISWQRQGDVYARKYAATGAAISSETLVNQRITDTQESSWVAIDGSGNFVVTWVSYNQDGDGAGIYARKYNAAGVPQTNEFLVNTQVTSHQVDPRVAVDGQGNFAITWTSLNQDGNAGGIYAQRYNAAAQKLGGPILVNSITAGDQQKSNIAMDRDGDFVVTWHTADPNFTNDDAFARRFNAAGVAQGAEFRVHSATTGNQRNTSVAMDADGDFVVSWDASTTSGDIDVYARRYSAAGAALGSEFLVNSPRTTAQFFSSVAMDADGDFQVVWASNGQDGSDHGVYSRRYSGSSTTRVPASSGDGSATRVAPTLVTTASATEEAPSMLSLTTGRDAALDRLSFQLVDDEVESSLSKPSTAGEGPTADAAELQRKRRVRTSQLQ